MSSVKCESCILSVNRILLQDSFISSFNNVVLMNDYVFVNAVHSYVCSQVLFLEQNFRLKSSSSPLLFLFLLPTSFFPQMQHLLFGLTNTISYNQMQQLDDFHASFSWDLSPLLWYYLQIFAIDVKLISDAGNAGRCCSQNVSISPFPTFSLL